MPAPWRHPFHRAASSLPEDLRRTGVPEHVRAWVAHHAGAPVVAVRRLPGATSTAVHEVVLGTGRRLVVRRYVWRDFRDEEPDAPQRELDPLEWAARHELPVPQVVAADPTGAVAGDDIPVLLMTRVPGRARANPDVVALAEAAASIHAVDATGLGHSFFPWCRDTSTRPPTGAASPTLWEEAHELWRSAEPAYQAQFVHRDFHPGNVLFRRGTVAGVVDWPNACAGPVGIDVATCRWNLEDLAGRAAADAFVAAYEARTRTSHHPYWDLAWLLEFDYDVGAHADRVPVVESRLARVVPLVRARHPG